MGKTELDIKNYESVIQFVKFSVVGLSNTVISLFVYYLFLWLEFNYLIANTLSWVISVFNAFYWNNKYVFKNENTWLKALIRTYLSYGFSFILGSVLLALLVELFHVAQELAPLAVLVVTIPLNFLMNKFWTFR